MAYTTTLACLAFVGLLLNAERAEWTAGRVVFKLAASACFVLLAWALGATDAPYGQLILLGLSLGWLGDALLLSDKPSAFMAGLGAFLLSHLVFAVAFLNGEFVWLPIASGLSVALIVAVVVFRWLLPHTPSSFRTPVVSYVVVILLMCAAAFGHSSATGNWLALSGALLFAASDIATERRLGGVFLRVMCGRCACRCSGGMTTRWPAQPRLPSSSRVMHTIPPARQYPIAATVRCCSIRHYFMKPKRCRLCRVMTAGVSKPPACLVVSSADSSLSHRPPRATGAMTSWLRPFATARNNQSLQC